MKKIILLSLLFLMAIPVFSQKLDNTDLKVTHGPYLQNISGSGVTIVFTTNLPAVPAVNISTPEGSGRLIRNSRDGIIDGGGTVHKVRIDGLEAGKTYKYRLNAVQVMKYQAYKIYYGDTINGREEAFSTPAPGTGEVSFTVINDVHENAGKMGSYLRSGNKDARDVIFFNGDMVDFLQDEEELFPGFIDTAVHYFARQQAFHLVRGNHETRGYRARELKQYFDFLNDKYYYSFDRGPVHFIVLDCGEDKPDNNRYYYGLADYDRYRAEELEWLNNEVKSPAFRNASKRVVIVHMPIIKQEKQGHGMKYLSEHFGPVLQQAGIDLMISGHTHRNTWYEKEKSGFGYNVLVNSANTFVEVEADKKLIRATVKDVDGKVINTYEIK